jgi:hypothetical protein
VHNFFRAGFRVCQNNCVSLQRHLEIVFADEKNMDIPVARLDTCNGGSPT